MLCFSLLRMMDCLSFDKVQVNAGVLTAVRKLSECWGLTDLQGNVLRNGGVKSAMLLVVRACVH